MATAIILKSMDGREFKTTEEIIKCSGVLCDMLGVCKKGEVPLTTVDGDTLEKVLKWAEYHQEDAAALEDEEKPPEICPFDKDLLEGDLESVMELIMAANFLHVKGLLNVACKYVAEMLMGKTPEQIREHFGIDNDLSAVDIEQIRLENEWCEEK